MEPTYVGAARGEGVGPLAFARLPDTSLGIPAAFVRLDVTSAGLL